MDSDNPNKNLTPDGMSNSLPKLPFAYILVKDDKTKGFTAFFKQFPDVIAEGDTEKQALSNLFRTLATVLECDTERHAADVPKNHVTQKTIQLQAVPA